MRGSIPPIPYTKFQLHCLVFATFASLVAPFGGFFASGFKRAFNLKDFGDSIPGHGGMTDRMDCQYVFVIAIPSHYLIVEFAVGWDADHPMQSLFVRFLMGVFSYVYYSALVREHQVTVGSVLQTIVSGLSPDEQVELFYDLKKHLDGVGALSIQ